MLLIKADQNLHLIPVVFPLLMLRRNIFFSKFFYLFSGGFSCLFRHSYRIPTQICDHSCCSLLINHDPFVKLLRNTHCFLSGKIQYSSRFLLQCACCKRLGRILYTFPLFYFVYHKLCPCKLFLQNFHLYDCS